MNRALKCKILFSLVVILFGATAWAQPMNAQLNQYKKALVSFRADKFEDAIKSLKELQSEDTNLQEYIHYYLAQSYMKLKKLDEADAEIKKLLSLSPNIKMSIEASNMQGKVALEKKDHKQAGTLFRRLERRTRNTEDYPEVIHNLAIAEKGLGRSAQMCRWLLRLYERYPAYGEIKDWGADLADNSFQGKKVGCRSTTDNFRTRVRHLLFAGLDEKAQKEINELKAKLVETDKFAADRLQAQFYMQEGEIHKAVEILKPYYETQKKDFDFLILFASAAARAGDVQLAVGSYYAAHKLKPKSKTGRQALYQSAFLSYQFQDYDGAARRFQEFQKIYPRSGLHRDAQWHLAWLKYLKGDYQGSHKAFAQMTAAKKKSPRVWRSIPQDRLDYWTAMSLYRQGKEDQARPLLEKLSKDPLMGYYSITAQARLKKMNEIATPKLVQSSLPTRPRMISRFSASEFLMPSVHEEYFYRGDDGETEDSILITQYSAEDEKGESEEAEGGIADNPDLKSIDIAIEEIAGSGTFSNPTLLKRFERARDMMILGEYDWARWDLYDIERRTSNRDHLRTLMTEYHMAGNFHRSSYIAQINFGAQRAAHGVSGVRYLWEFAYPRAYSSDVEKYAKRFKVPEELVWGIMRAETNYRRDAISPVGALGLMQVMPFTGHKVATLLKEKNFQSTQLLEPEVSVKIGSRYLKRLMDRFDNMMPLVAAGYNAGPHRVKNWLVSFGNLDTDEFIEHIPFVETRNYVKRVVSNIYIYGQLYDNKEDIFPYLASSVPVKIPEEMVGKENWDDI